MADTASSTETRLIRDADVESFVRLVVRYRDSIGGSRHPSVIRAVARDAARGGDALIVVHVVDAEVVGGIVVLVGGSVPYWRTFPLHHPVAGAIVLGTRARRVVRARLARARGSGPPSAEVAPGQVDPRTASLPDDLRNDPRLHVDGPSSPDAPHPRDAGPKVAYGLTLWIDDRARQRGLGSLIFQTALDELAARGIERYNCSFRLDNEPAIRMHLRLGFDVYCFPDGYLGTIELHPPVSPGPVG